MAPAASLQNMAKLSHFFIICLVFHLIACEEINKEEIFRRVSENVTLPCTLVTHVNITTQLFWKRDSKIIIQLKKHNHVWNTDNVMRRNHKIDLKDFSLLLMWLGVQDSGTYMCEATLDNTMTLTSQHFVLTVQDVPSKPPRAPVVTVIDAYAIDVTWEPSMRDNNSPIIGYIVEYKSLDEDQIYQKQVKNVNHTMIDNLWPFIEYTVRVVAINDIGDSIPSSFSKPVRTREAAPTGKVHNVRSHSINSTAIYVEWERPAANLIRGILRGYVLQHQLAAGGMPIARSVMDQNLTSWNFTNLKPYSAYFIKIKISNDAGDGPDTIVTEWTDEGVPSKPRITYIPNRTHDSLQIEWEKPNHINGNLIGYTIYVTDPTDDSASRQFDLPSTNREHMKTYIITQLKPYTQYKIQVSARTKKGHSEKSDEFPGLTDVKGPGAPGNITKTLNSSTSIWIEWTQPKVFVKQVDLYYIRYRARDQTDYIKLQYIPSSQTARLTEYIDKLEPKKKKVPTATLC